MELESLFELTIKDEQDLVEESLVGDFIFESESKGHGRPKSKKNESLFDKCKAFLSEASQRLEVYKQLRSNHASVK